MCVCVHVPNTQGVLYGIFPAVLLGMAVCYAYMRHMRRPISKLRAAYATGEANVVLKDVYRFKDEFEVGSGALHHCCLVTAELQPTCQVACP